MMERAFDNMLNGLFGGVSPMINATAGVVIIIIGIVLLFLAKNQSSKGGITAVWLCIGVGSLAFLSGFFQLLLA